MYVQTAFVNRQTQGCQIFLDTIYQTKGKYTKSPLKFKWSYNILHTYINDRKKIKMAMEYTNLYSFQGPPKSTRIGIFGLKLASGNPEQTASKLPASHYLQFENKSY
jgi:hypothetical protein